MEIVVGAYDSRVYVWETRAPYTPEALAWPTEKGNYQRTGLYGQHWVIMETDEKQLPRNYNSYIFPNPFNSSCRIIPPTGTHAEIYDLTGRLIHRFESAVTTDRTEYIWEPGNNIGSGIYLVRFVGNSNPITRKLVYIK